MQARVRALVFAAAGAHHFAATRPLRTQNHFFPRPIDYDVNFAHGGRPIKPGSLGPSDRHKQQRKAFTRKRRGRASTDGCWGLRARAPPRTSSASRPAFYPLILQAGYKDQVRIAMDVAASEFAVGEIGAGKRPGYDLAKKQPGSNGAGVVTGEALQALYEGMLAKYPIISIEDPFEQEVGRCGASARASVPAGAAPDLPPPTPSSSPPPPCPPNRTGAAPSR
jgi:hypothetical protein